MKNQTNYKSTTFLRVLIYFYRIFGITFGGVSLDEKDNLTKSRFWFYYGWFGCLIYFISIMLLIFISLSQQTFAQLDQDFGRLQYYIIAIIWPVLGFTIVGFIVYINQKYGFKILSIFVEFSLGRFKALKPVKVILFVLPVIWIITFVVQSCVYRDTRHIIASFVNNLLLLPLFISIISVSWIISIGFSENIKFARKFLNKNMSNNKILIKKVGIH